MKKSFKDYDFLEVIGKGGMAVLYKGYQRSLARNVAIKELHTFLLDNENFIDRFEREAKALASLMHENVVQVFDFGKEQDSYYIVMEYVEGLDLKELMKSTTKFPLEIALMVIYQICSGLEHAHSSGITHRDMKPGNVLMNKFGVVKIADFGLAQAANLDSITVTGSLIGTPAYMSPEQAAGKKVDHRSDIFSVGVMLYEMISSKKPYEGDSYASVIAKILTQKPRQIIEIEPNLPPDVINIINKSLAKDVEKRYADIGIMLQDMESYFGSIGITPNKRLVKKFMENPAEYQEKYKDKFVNEHLNKGIYYMQMGLEKFDDASTEFNRVLSIDPKNENAEKYLKDIKKKREESGIFEPPPKPPVSEALGPDDVTGQTPTPTPIPETPASTLTHTQTPIPETPKYTPIAQAPKKKSKVPLIIGFVIIAIIAVLAFIQFGTDYKLIVLSETPTTSIHLEFKPEDATVYLDNKPVGNKSPIDLKNIEIGQHTLEIKKEGYTGEKMEIELLNDRPFKKIYELEKIPAEKPKAISVNVTTDPPNAKVILDGKKEIMSPGKFENVKPGLHILTIKYEHKPGIIIEKEKSFTAKPGDVLDYQIDLKKDLDKILKTSLTIISKPSGAKIYRNGKYIGKKTPIQTSQYTPGKYTFKFIKTGYITREMTFEVKPNIANKINVTLQKLPVDKPPEPEPEPEPEPGPDEPEPPLQPPPPPPVVPKTAFLKIKVVPWAKIYIDGKYFDTTPISKSIEVKTGSHTIKAANPGFEVWEETIDFPGGKTITKKITLKKKAAPVSSKGFLKITVSPWAKLYIDGNYIDTTPIGKPIPLSEGTHKIKLENPGRKIHEEEIEIKSGEILEKNIKLLFK
ncbi:PEGA domain-containing protein [Candidatus Dependentiae bacterium]|nr:PEGA domain-containing protein [Candidatus Dependentiae bacterium]